MDQGRAAQDGQAVESQSSTTHQATIPTPGGIEPPTSGIGIKPPQQTTEDRIATAQAMGTAQGIISVQDCSTTPPVASSVAQATIIAPVDRSTPTGITTVQGHGAQEHS